ncbi:WhiB family transcriptional regulator [Mycolicibacterium sp. XJ766]
MTILGATLKMVTGQEDWADRAACTDSDPEAWFPEKGQNCDFAKRICRGCEVRDECLEYALTHRERHGVFGGYTEKERRAMRRPA